MKRKSASKRSGARVRGAAAGLLAIALLSACQSGAPASGETGSGGQETGSDTSIGTAEAAGTAAATKFGIATDVLSSRIDPADVKWTYMTWPLMTDQAATMYAGRDDDDISRLVAWIDEARPVEGTGLSAPIKNRSMAVNVELRDGRSVVVRPARRCETSKLDEGRTQTSCEPVADRVAIEDSASGGRAGTTIAESAELYRFVNEGYKDVMPPVHKYEWPAQLKAGANFTIRGHGARSQEATVTLSKKGAALWKSTADIDDGEWSVVGTVPSDLKAEGSYELEIRTEEGGISTYLDVE